MSRTSQAVEVNKFSAGLITDASPLTSVENSSLDEDNMVLNIDGSRNRRLGMDYETNFSRIDSGLVPPETGHVVTTSYKWNNAGGDAATSIEVIQIGNQLKFFRLGGANVSNELIHSTTLESTNNTVRFSYAVVDGILIIANGSKLINRYEYDPSDSSITYTTSTLLTRDFFGVADVNDGVDITRGSAVQNRPNTLSQAHLYNLRNQSFGIPRTAGNNEQILDPITDFHNRASRYPSNSDTVTEALYADPSDTGGRTKDRFFAIDLRDNPLGTARAPLGYFIIDALDRGTSRLQQDSDNRARYSPLSGRPVTTLPLDQTPGGATLVAEYAGRVWYAGFSGEVIDGDSSSPKLSAYVFFSQVVESPADINLCYQEGDPTSKHNPDIIATDGGFIRLNEAYGIQKLVNIGSSLMIVATNGVWLIQGGTDNGFTATSYIVSKISDRGSTSPGSIVQIENSVMFWSDDAIYHVATDQFGSYNSQNVSYGRIQRFYDNIEVDSKRNAVGDYDSYERKVRWLFDNRSDNTSPTRELILDTQLQAYYTNTIRPLSGSIYPKPVAIYRGLPYQINSADDNVVVGVEDVIITNGEEVVIRSDNTVGINRRELGYLILTGVDGNLEYTFGRYSDTSFADWVSEDGVGIDAAAYMITNYLSGGDFQRDKGATYVTIHLRRTETGYDPEMNPQNPSSCLVQARWGWATNDLSGKWGREFQAYRYRRMHLPLDDDDDHDNGFLTVNSKNKIRGNGKVLSLRFRTEPYHDLHLYGWSMIFTVSDN
jgi:hypothetical protein